MDWLVFIVIILYGQLCYWMGYFIGKQNNKKS